LRPTIIDPERDFPLAGCPMRARRRARIGLRQPSRCGAGWPTTMSSCDVVGPCLGARFLGARFLGVRWLGCQTRQPNIREGPAHRQLETALSALASAAAGLSAEPCDRRPSDRAVDYFKTGSRTPNRDGGRAGPKSREKWRIFRAASRHSQERTFHYWKSTAIRPRGVAEIFSRDFFGVGCAL
jgi:hypothetical protein